MENNYYYSNLPWGCGIGYVAGCGYGCGANLYIYQTHKHYFIESLWLKLVENSK